MAAVARYYSDQNVPGPSNPQLAEWGIPRGAEIARFGTEQELLAFESGERTNDWHSVMQHVASGLGNADIKALADYYSSLPPSEAASE